MGDGARQSRPGLGLGRSNGNGRSRSNGGGSGSGSGLSIRGRELNCPECQRAGLSSSAAGKGSPPLGVSGAPESGRPMLFSP
jgi:hypothetical protein